MTDLSLVAGPQDGGPLDGLPVEPGERRESRVRTYSRSFPGVFTAARGAELVAEDGRTYLDFLCGAGALNYGHNHPRIKQAVLDHLAGDGLVHGLDLDTAVKRAFLDRLDEVVLRPRGLPHRVQFCGPTGANAVEAALKLARKATGRSAVVAFTGAFHGMSLGALSVSGRLAGGRAGGVSVPDVTFVPYEDGPGGRFDSVGHLERLLADEASGLPLPAAVIVESVQMDGGVYPASVGWLRDLRALTRRHGIPLVCDEIQSGCGRTGDFFGFEAAGIQPDLVTVSKSVGGLGLPLSLLLIRPDLDVWSPGEHTGTFRANQLALVAATAALELWTDPGFRAAELRSSRRLAEFRAELAALEPALGVRGRGMVAGLDTAGCGGPGRAREVQRRCFADGLIVELCGRGDTVLKLLPPLTIEPGQLERGLAILRRALDLSRLR